MVTTLTTCGVNESGALLKESMSIRPEAIGKIFMFAGNTAPEGTLYCNGAAISRTTYSELFAAIGTTYGAGDGSTTFNLPDLRGRWIVGADAEQAAGEEVAEGLPNITGDIIFRDNNAQGPNLNRSNVTIPSSSLALFEVAATTGYENMLQLDIKQYSPTGTQIHFDASHASAIYGASAHVTPESVALLPCIIYE